MAAPLGSHGKPNRRRVIRLAHPSRAGGRRSNGFAADGRRGDVGKWNVRGDWANRLARVEFGASPCPRRFRRDGFGRRYSGDCRPFVRCGLFDPSHSRRRFHSPSLLETPAVDLSDCWSRRLLARHHRTPHRPSRRPRESARRSGVRQRRPGDVVNPPSVARRNHRLPPGTQDIAASNARRGDLQPPGLRGHRSRGGKHRSHAAGALAYQNLLAPAPMTGPFYDIPASENVSMLVENSRFVPSAFNVTAFNTTRITVLNEDDAPHTFTYVNNGTTYSHDLPGGSTTRFFVLFLAPGTVPFWSIPDRSGGMVGNITVKPG